MSADDLLNAASENCIETSPLDVYALTKHLGIKFSCIPMPDETSGSLTFDERGWLITVNALHHPNRQRFTIAHELAHYALHRKSREEFRDQNFFRNDCTDPMEAEANHFAATLLMPEPAFRKAAEALNGDIEAIAKSFKVSTMAVRVRAKILGFKGHGLNE